MTGVQAAAPASPLRGVGPAGLLAIAVVLAGALAGPLVAATFVLMWAFASGTPLRALGFRASHRGTARTVVAAFVAGAALKLVAKSLIMPLLGTPPINPVYHYLQGNAAALPGTIATILLSAGIGEEVFFRGYLFERVGVLLGRGRSATAAALTLSTVLFALAHYPDQRWPGVEQAALTGLVFGGLFAWRRNIWLVIAAHVAFDLVAVALIYWGWESRVAHLLIH